MIRSGGRGIGPLAIVVLVVLGGTVAGVGVAVRPVDAAGQAATSAAVVDPGPDERLSFEDGTAGENPPGPWTVRSGDGVHRVSSSYPGHGDLSVHVRGASGLGTSEVAVPVDLTGVATIQLDAYVETNRNSRGELQVRLSNRDGHVMGFTQVTPDRWYEDTRANVSSVSGERELILHARGSDNGGYFDDVRFLDADGDTVPVSEVVVGTPDGDDGALLVDGFEDGAVADDWTDVEAAEVTTADTYAGDYALAITDRNDEMNEDTGNRIVRSFPASRPGRLAAAVKIDDGTYNDLRVRWRNESDVPIHTINIDVYNGGVYYGTEARRLGPADPYRWYYVVLDDIDWSTDTVGTIRVDGETVATDVPFRNPGDRISEVSLSTNDVGTGSRSFFDDVTVPTGEDGDGDEGTTATRRPTPTATGSTRTSTATAGPRRRTRPCCSTPPSRVIRR
jgi:hypothetical protein